MDISINKHDLSDSPYQKENEGICTFDQIQINNFVSELIFGNQTCYLVSGYRGVGKTSFINKVRQIIEEKNQIPINDRKKRILLLDKKKPETYYPVFVHASFAKYNSQTAFLRQMIRSLFLSFDEKKIDGKSVLSQLSDDSQKQFRLLNQRTFFDIKTQHEISKESVSEETIELKTKLNDLITGVIKAVIPGPFLILIERLAKNYSGPDWLSIILWIGGIGLFLWGLIDIRNAKSLCPVFCEKLDICSIVSIFWLSLSSFMLLKSSLLLYEMAKTCQIFQTPNVSDISRFQP